MAFRSFLTRLKYLNLKPDKSQVENAVDFFAMVVAPVAIITVYNATTITVIRLNNQTNKLEQKVKDLEEEIKRCKR
jgi:hypothetical protein